MRLFLGCAFALSLVCNSVSAPANNNFANRIVLPNNTNYITATGNNVGATKEPLEPVHGTNVGGASVWWAWTAPSNGAFLVTTHGSSFDTMLAVYTGSSLASLTQVAVDDNSVTPYNTNYLSDIVSFNATANTTYLIAVDGKSNGTNAAQGNIVLRILPDNDSFTNRIFITGASYEWTTFNSKASKESLERNHISGSTLPSPGKSLWWEWKPPTNGSYLISTYPCNFDPVLAVYRVTGANINNTVRVINDTNHTAGSDFFEFKGNITNLVVTNINDVFRIAVDGLTYLDNGQTNTRCGMITLSIMPDNDYLGYALPLSGAYAHAKGFSATATDDGEALYNSVHSVWWKWSPPSNGTYIVTTLGSAFDTFLVVYTNTYNPPTVAGLKQGQYSGYSDDNGASQETVYADDSSVVLTDARTNLIYYIKVDGADDLEVGAIVLDIFPNNDRMTNRIVLTGTNVTSVSANGKAASDGAYEWTKLNEVAAGNFSFNQQSVWWSWTAPTNGTVTINTMGSSFPANVLAVYTGNAYNYSDFKLVAYDFWTQSQWGQDKPVEVSIITVPGMDYKIQITGIGTSDGNVVVNLNFTAAAGVPNDNFANAARLTGATTSAVVSNYFATKEIGETSHAGEEGGRSVWWQWTPVESGYVTITTSNSTSSYGGALDTVLAVYTGTNVTKLSMVATNNNDDTNSLITSLVTFSATAGITYYIAVDCVETVNGLDAGMVRLSLIQSVPPPNDNFINRILIAGLPAVTNINTTNATKEVGEPNHAGDSGGASVWWSWRAPFTGPVIISTEGSTFNTLLAVYTGTNVAALTLINQNDLAKQEGVNYSRLTLQAVSNQVYQIAVDGLVGGTGNAILKITPRPTISALTPLPNLAFRFSFPTFSGFSYEIIVSDDLINWWPMQPVDGTGNIYIFEDPDALLESRRFYRILEY